MALTAAEKRLRNAAYQARWRERREALVKAHPEVLERELLQAAQRCERLSDQERLALADRLADLAMGYQWRATKFAALARKVRVGEG
jgi:hypothetical protein